MAGGVSVYVRDAFGERAAAVTGVWFLLAVIAGAPAVALVGGSYAADLAGAGRGVAVAVAAMILACVLAANTAGLRVSSGLQLALAAALMLALAPAIALVLPAGGAGRWSPFAPHGWWAVGVAANLLVWHVIGWEAMAQLAGDFGRPRHDIPRAVGLAFGVVAVLYAGLAVATVQVSGAGSSTVPLADLLDAGLGDAGRAIAAPLAVALTLGTTNVYHAGAARLAGALARERALPAWLGQEPEAAPRRPLAVLAVTGGVLLGGLAAGALGVEDLVRAASACFVAVYVLALAAAVRILRGAARACAACSLALVLVVAAFSGPFLLAPVLAGAGAMAVHARRARREARVH